MGLYEAVRDRQENISVIGLGYVGLPLAIAFARVAEVIGASHTLGRNLTRGSIVVYESTAYPGVTEDICVPILESESGLTCGAGFKIGYSPERINPGDKVHRLETIIKIVSGMDAGTLDDVAKVYEMVVSAGVHRAQSIKDMIKAQVLIATAKVGILGLTFKENCPDIRNTRVVDIFSELREYGVEAIVSDPEADPEEAKREYGIELQPMSEMTDLDVLIDVKSLLDKTAVEALGYRYWRLLDGIYQHKLPQGNHISCHWRGGIYWLQYLRGAPRDGA